MQGGNLCSQRALGVALANGVAEHAIFREVAVKRRAQGDVFAPRQLGVMPGIEVGEDQFGALAGGFQRQRIAGADRNAAAPAVQQ